MASSSQAPILAKPYKSNFTDALSPRLPSPGAAMTVLNETSVSSYEYANKGSKHLMSELNRRTSQRKRPKVGVGVSGEVGNISFKAEFLKPDKCYELFGMN